MPDIDDNTEIMADLSFPTHNLSTPLICNPWLEDQGVPPVSLAIAWLTHHGDHILPTSGRRNVEHLKELVQGAAVDRTDEDLARIDDALQIGRADGDCYAVGQLVGPEKYC